MTMDSDFTPHSRVSPVPGQAPVKFRTFPVRHGTAHPFHAEPIARPRTGQRQTILVGTPDQVIRAAYVITESPRLGYTLGGAVLLGANDVDIDRCRDIHPDLEILPSTNQIGRNENALVCVDDVHEPLMPKIIEGFKSTGVDFAIAPLSKGQADHTLLSGPRVEFMVAYNSAPLTRSRVLKFLMDRVGAGVLLALLSPVFLILALKVRKDGGPVFYGQRRIGKDGREFRCWKFRSMVPNAADKLAEILATDPALKAEWDRDFKLKNDPRITPIGEKLRKTSLDELPQLWNVLMGDMSLVGPRPVTKAETEFYGENFVDYISVKPGMTGLWQVSGRNDVTYNRRVFLDTWYVRSWSFWNDLVILFKTVGVVAFHRGSY